jgi:CheY-like chemotaxis protein
MVMLALAIGYERSRSMAERRADAATARADERVAATERTHRASLDWLSEALAHEANNTLAYVMADLARLESRATADVARLGAERLRHLVRDVRIVAGGEQEQPADCAPVDLDRLVKEVVDEVAPLLGRLGVAIERRAAAGPVFASADAVALGRCIASALIASTPETSLGVTALDGERPAILITAPKGLVEQRPLTLKAVRLTIEALGGTMRTEATDTQATIRLELVGAEPPRAPATAVVPAAEATALRVLIVDDEPLILRTAKRLLSRFDVTTTTSPVEALELVQKERFDVFVCDFSMPEMRGDAVFASAVDRGFDPKHFVLMTGGSTVPIERAFGSRRPILLEKPYTRGELEGAIGRAVASAG